MGIIGLFGPVSGDYRLIWTCQWVEHKLKHIRNIYLMNQALLYAQICLVFLVNWQTADVDLNS